MEGKHILKSKTFWVNLAFAVAPLFPGALAVIESNLATFTLVWGAVSVVLRMLTKDRVVLVD